jgi:hypothetical protein
MQIKQRQCTGLKCRGYKETYENESIALTGIDQNSGNVRGIRPDGQAVKCSIREVQPVPEDSTAVRDPPGQGVQSDVHVEDKRCEGTRALRDKVHAFLDIPRTVLSIRNHIGTEGVK